MKHKTIPTMHRVTTCPDDMVECWGFIIALPSVKDMLANSEYTKALPVLRESAGFIGMCPNVPYNVIVVFDTENHAKVGMNRYKATGLMAGDNVGKLFIDKQYYQTAQDVNKLN